jgi:hypothetical protein
MIQRATEAVDRQRRIDPSSRSRGRALGRWLGRGEDRSRDENQRSEGQVARGVAVVSSLGLDQCCATAETATPILYLERRRDALLTTTVGRYTVPTMVKMEVKNRQTRRDDPWKLKGLFTTFIARRIREYQEPSREGTPRGEVVGFSRQKYLAVLCSLTSLPLQTIAKKVGVSEKLLQKWRAEPEFKKKLAVEATLFGEIVANMARSMATAKDTAERELMQKSLDEIAAHEPLRIVLPDEWFGDVPLYGPRVVEALINYETLYRIQQMDAEIPLEAAERAYAARVWSELVRIIHGVVAPRLTGKDLWAAFQEKERKHAQLTMLRIALRWLMAPTLDEETRKEAVSALRRLELSLADDAGRGSGAAG